MKPMHFICESFIGVVFDPDLFLGLEVVGLHLLQFQFHRCDGIVDISVHQDLDVSHLFLSEALVFCFVGIDLSIGCDGRLHRGLKLAFLHSESGDFFLGLVKQLAVEPVSSRKLLFVMVDRPFFLCQRLDKYGPECAVG